MNDFKNMSERYRQQMLDLYNRYPKDIPSPNKNTNNNSNIDVPKDINNTNNTINTILPTQDIKNVTDTNNMNTNQNMQPTTENPPTEDTTPIEERYPQPVIPPFIYQSNHPEDTATTNETTPVENQPDGIGYLKVIVTSANKTIPLPNVSVIVSKEVDGGDEILYSLLTNDSGETSIVELSAPPRSLSESPSTSGVKPYSEYKISTYLNGYFQVINLRVPIFSGITSIQNINLIPLPSHTIERLVNTITIPESEPNL